MHCTKCHALLFSDPPTCTNGFLRHAYAHTRTTRFGIYDWIAEQYSSALSEFQDEDDHLWHDNPRPCASRNSSLTILISLLDHLHLLNWIQTVIPVASPADARRTAK